MAAARMAGRFRNRMPQVEKIMLIPLIDILTIMVVFLIASASMTDLVPSQALKLPLSTAEKPAEYALKITISKEDIRVDDKVVVPVENGQVYATFKDRLLILPLFDNLKSHVARREAVAKVNPELAAKFAENVVLIADRDTPAALIDEVLYTVSQQNFHKFQLLINKKPRLKVVP